MMGEFDRLSEELQRLSPKRRSDNASRALFFIALMLLVGVSFTFGYVVGGRQ